MVLMPGPVSSHLSYMGPPQIGFVFNLNDAKWDQSWEELRMVAEGNGGVANVSEKDPERPALGKWCIGQV